MNHIKWIIVGLAIAFAFTACFATLADADEATPSTDIDLYISQNGEGVRVVFSSDDQIPAGNLIISSAYATYEEGKGYVSGTETKAQELQPMPNEPYDIDLSDMQFAKKAYSLKAMYVTDDAQKYESPTISYVQEPKKAINIALELIDPEIGTLSVKLDPYYTEKITQSIFFTALKSGLDAKKIPYNIKSDGWISSIGDYAGHGSWDYVSDYYDFSVYFDNNGKWDYTSTYAESYTFAIVFHQYAWVEDYEAMTPAEQEHYMYFDMANCYTWKPSFQPATDYEMFVSQDGPLAYVSILNTDGGSVEAGVAKLKMATCYYEEELGFYVSEYKYVDVPIAASTGPLATAVYNLSESNFYEQIFNISGSYLADSGNASANIPKISYTPVAMNEATVYIQMYDPTVSEDVTSYTYTFKIDEDESVLDGLQMYLAKDRIAYEIGDSVTSIGGYTAHSDDTASYGFSVYFMDEQGWVYADDFTKNGIYSIVFDRFISDSEFVNLDDQTKVLYEDSNLGYYTKLTSFTYKYYLQFRDDSMGLDPIEQWTGTYTATTQSKESFVASLRSLLNDAGISNNIADNGWIVSIGDFASHGQWDFKSEFYDFGIYYRDGGKWSPTSDYTEGTTFAIVFDKYLWEAEYKALPESEKSKYINYEEWGYAGRLPDVSLSSFTYKFYLQLHDDEMALDPIDQWTGTYVASTKSKESFVTSLRTVLNEAGIANNIADDGWLFSIGDFSSHGQWDYESDYYDFAIYYRDGSKWTATSDYTEGTTFAIVFDKYLWEADYNALSPQEKSKYVNYEEWGYAGRLPDVNLTAYTYKFYLQLHDDSMGLDPIDQWTGTYTATTQKKNDFVNALRSVLDDAGIANNIADNAWIVSIGDFASHGQWDFKSEFYDFGIYYLDGGNWVPTSDYTESTTFAIVFDKYLWEAEYQALPESEKSKYINYEEWGYAGRLPDIKLNALTYKYYLQFHDDELGLDPVEQWTGTYTASTQSKKEFVNSIRALLDEAGISYNIPDDGWILSIGDFSSHGQWDYKSDFYDFGVYYAEGGKWLPTADYTEGTTFAIVFDQYLWEAAYNALPDDEKSKYINYEEWGYAGRLPDVAA